MPLRDAQKAVGTNCTRHNLPPMLNDLEHQLVSVTLWRLHRSLHFVY